jgi:hypothetical protein
MTETFTPYKGRDTDPVYAERGAALMAQWDAEAATHQRTGTGTVCDTCGQAH